MKTKYQPEVLEALDETIESYEDTLEILRSRDRSEEDKNNLLHKWRNYGSNSSCRLCTACQVPNIFTYKLDCEACPLYADNGASNPCADDDDDTLENLTNAIDEYYDTESSEKTTVIKAMQARLDFIKQRSEENINAG